MMEVSKNFEADISLEFKIYFEVNKEDQNRVNQEVTSKN